MISFHVLSIELVVWVWRYVRLSFLNTSKTRSRMDSAVVKAKLTDGPPKHFAHSSGLIPGRLSKPASPRGASARPRLRPEALR
jgi:hypothetical protein